MAEQVWRSLPSAAKNLALPHRNRVAESRLPMLAREPARQVNQIIRTGVARNRNCGSCQNFGIGYSQARPQQHCSPVFASLETIRKRHEQPVLAGIVVFETRGSIFRCFLLLLHFIEI